MARASASEVRNLLATRQRYLELLYTEAKQKPQIEAELGDCRSTVNYAIRELCDLGLVHRVAEGYRATAFGQLAYRTAERYDSKLGGLCAAHAPLSTLSAGTPVEPVVFDGADVSVGQPHAPDQPVYRLLAAMREATAVTALVPIVRPDLVRTCHGKIVDDGVRADLVLSNAVVERLASKYGEQFEELLRVPTTTAYESVTSPPFGLFLLESPDQHQLVLLLSDARGVHGAVVNETDGALSWGRSVYETYEERATALPS